MVATWPYPTVSVTVVDFLYGLIPLSLELCLLGTASLSTWEWCDSEQGWFLVAVTKCTCVIGSVSLNQGLHSFIKPDNMSEPRSGLGIQK
jgi:hypothetical protein